MNIFIKEQLYNYSKLLDEATIKLNKYKSTHYGGGIDEKINVFSTIKETAEEYEKLEYIVDKFDKLDRALEIFIKKVDTLHEIYGAEKDDKIDDVRKKYNNFLHP